MKTKPFISKTPRSRIVAFSLIELMTVVSIMAVLTAVATPGIQVAMMNAKQSAALANARSIVLGIRSYSQDYDGAFPSLVNEEGDEINSSNAAFRELLPEYIDTERVFAVSRSTWGPKADGRIDEPEDRLREGENHFAYIAGLDSASRSDWPLVVDGTNGSGFYTRTRGAKGGCWEGRRGIVVTVGGSGQTIRLRGEDDARYLPRIGYPEENALEIETYMGENARFLEPEE